MSIKTFFLSLLLLFSFSAPTIAQKQKKPCFCMMVYAPVCGVNGKTYSNACKARCAGIKVAYKGRCKAPKKKKAPSKKRKKILLKKLIPTPQPKIKLAQPAPKTFVPLDSLNKKFRIKKATHLPTTKKIKKNQKLPPRAQQTQKSKKSPLKKSKTPKQKKASKRKKISCQCPLILMPVCGTDGKTYPNACVARCQKVKIRYKGSCQMFGPNAAKPLINAPKNPCANIQCPKGKHCQVIKGKAQCVCPPVCLLYCKYGLVKKNGCLICKCRTVNGKAF